jgi:hypothetical protein
MAELGLRLGPSRRVDTATLFPLSLRSVPVAIQIGVAHTALVVITDISSVEEVREYAEPTASEELTMRGLGTRCKVSPYPNSLW